MWHYKPILSTTSNATQKVNTFQNCFALFYDCVYLMCFCRLELLWWQVLLFL